MLNSLKDEEDFNEFKELAQSHGLWKYELYSVVYMNIIKKQIFHTH